MDWQTTKQWRNMLAASLVPLWDDWAEEMEVRAALYRANLRLRQLRVEIRNAIWAERWEHDID